MSAPRFFITDVFATERYSGNQLATVLHDGRMSDDTMQRIAAEFGFSETTFALSAEPIDGVHPIRIFTPKAEIPFAGHPILGTAAVLARHILTKEAEEIVLRPPVGPTPVLCPSPGGSSGLFWMRQNEPEFEDGLDVGLVAEVIGLKPEDIEPSWPISQVTTGLPFTIVPVRSLKALKSARVNAERYETWVESVWAKGLLLFSMEGRTPSEDLAVRVFVPYLGVPEDPATGSANGCLASYLLRHDVLSGEAVDVCVGQGHEVGRPSAIRLRARRDGRSYRIEIGGRVVDIASGHLTI
jgi:trans-2,3-dihydro-3-hydroxyanthranilate isomerase